MVAPVRHDKKLRRSRKDRKIAGVCGGLGEYLEIDSTLVRLIWLVLIFIGGTGVLAYIIAWIIMPEEPVAAPAQEATPSTAPQPVSSH
jgi:phage shock protein PspC (stress-responsive transcriptional regulator)